jgi:hypothetical protein
MRLPHTWHYQEVAEDIRFDCYASLMKGYLLLTRQETLWKKTKDYIKRLRRREKSGRQVFITISKKSQERQFINKFLKHAICHRAPGKILKTAVRVRPRFRRLNTEPMLSNKIGSYFRHRSVAVGHWPCPSHRRTWSSVRGTVEMF